MSETLKVCGLTIERGTKLRTYLPVPDTNVKIPLTIINGENDGPTLLITAGIHGGEYPGIAAAMELGRDIEPEHVTGCLIMMHPVNIQGFWARREMIVPEDGKNLNRVFPGDTTGTLADKTAYLISNNFFSIADFYVDMHSGDIHESLHPYVYNPGQPTPEVEKKSRTVARVLEMEYMVRSPAPGGDYPPAARTGGFFALRGNCTGPGLVLYWSHKERTRRRESAAPEIVKNGGDPYGSIDCILHRLPVSCGHQPDRKTAPPVHCGGHQEH